MTWPDVSDKVSSINAISTKKVRAVNAAFHKPSNFGLCEAAAPNADQHEKHRRRIMPKTKEPKKAPVKKYAQMTFAERLAWVSQKYFYEINHLVSEAKAQEALAIQTDPGNKFFGKSVPEVQRLIEIAQMDKIQVYRKGFIDALTTIKRVAEQEIVRVAA